MALVAAWLGSGIEGTQPRLRFSGTNGDSDGDGDARRGGGNLREIAAPGSSVVSFLSFRDGFTAD